MFDRFLSKIRTYFYYNNKELNGVVVLMLAILFLFVGVRLYKEYFFNEIDIKYFQSQIENLEKKGESKEVTCKYFSFDPNVIEKVDLEKLGFSVKQIKNLNNYRKAGGHFYKKEDFHKLYFVTDSIYKLYEPYLKISKSIKIKKGNPKKRIVKNRIEQISVDNSADSLFSFDPNTATAKQWAALGISKKVIVIINNYKNKGGCFYKPEDLKKIYGLSEEKYNQLLPYINIAEKETPDYPTQDTIITTYDLNTIGEKELQKIRVSLSMSRKLIKYREKLGGYVSMSQLLELYNIREWDLNLLHKHCEILSPVKQININTAGEKEFYEHPYLDFHDAQAIIRHRNRKGNYEKVEILKSRKILTKKTFDKVKFYLKVKD